jgi:hypothetical protein
MGVSSEVIARPFPGWSHDRTLSQELPDIGPVREDLCGKEAHPTSSSFNLTGHNNFLLRCWHYRLIFPWKRDPDHLRFSSRIRFGIKNDERLFLSSYGAGDSLERHDLALILFRICEDLINPPRPEALTEPSLHRC